MLGTIGKSETRQIEQARAAFILAGLDSITPDSTFPSLGIVRQCSEDEAFVSPLVILLTEQDSHIECKD